MTGSEVGDAAARNAQTAADGGDQAGEDPALTVFDWRVSFEPLRQDGRRAGPIPGGSGWVGGKEKREQWK